MRIDNPPHQECRVCHCLCPDMRALQTHLAWHAAESEKLHAIQAVLMRSIKPVTS